MSSPADSYDALRRSIERALATDLPHGAVAEMATSIDHALLEEARSGELTLAYLRVLAVGAYVGVAMWTFVNPESMGLAGYPAREALLALVWGGGTVALALALRGGWYRLWLRHVVPAADAAMIWSTFLLAWTGTGDESAQTESAAPSYVTALCGFLAVSGALRLSRSSAQLSTLLAVSIFVFAAAAAGLDFVHGVAIAITLVVAGALSATAPQRIRRVV